MTALSTGSSNHLYVRNAPLLDTFFNSVITAKIHQHLHLLPDVVDIPMEVAKDQIAHIFKALSSAGGYIHCEHLSANWVYRLKRTPHKFNPGDPALDRSLRPGATAVVETLVHVVYLDGWDESGEYWRYGVTYSKQSHPDTIFFTTENLMKPYGPIDAFCV